MEHVSLMSAFTTPTGDSLQHGAEEQVVHMLNKMVETPNKYPVVSRILLELNAIRDVPELSLVLSLASVGLAYIERRYLELHPDHPQAGAINDAIERAALPIHHRPSQRSSPAPSDSSSLSATESHEGK